MATKSSSDKLDFLREPPINGGNTYTTKQLLETQDDVIKSTMAIPANVKKKLYANSNANTYPFWYLLQFMADYFTNLVWFRFDSQRLTEHCYRVIRTSCIFGRACLKVVYMNGVKTIQSYYINRIETNGDGEPIKLWVYPSQELFFNQNIMGKVGEKDWDKDLSYIEIPYDASCYILNYSSAGWGGLTKWLYFLKQFQHLLKMLYTHSYSYVKSIIYNVSDRTASTDELDIFFSADSPFIVNLADDEVLGNRFKPFELSKGDKNDITTFLDNFLDIYYALIGRRTNIDFKKERNINSEVASSQDNFDTLQNEFKTYITLMLEWVEKQTTLPVIYNKFETVGLPSVQTERNSGDE